jgi:Ni/Co efflux regulator RcnB
MKRILVALITAGLALPVFAMAQQDQPKTEKSSKKKKTAKKKTDKRKAEQPKAQ